MPKHLNTADDFEMVAIERLKPHPNNVNEADTGAVIESIKAHGFYGALVVQRSTCHVVAGNHRLLAARTLGFSELPVTWITCDDEMAIRLMLTDNRSTRLGRDNPAALAELLAELAGTKQGLVGLGFDGDDLDQLLTELAGMPQSGLLDDADPDAIPDDAPTRVKPGDLWQLGNHRLLCGDSTKAEDVARLMGGEKANAVFTDPPYGVDYSGQAATMFYGEGKTGKPREKIENDSSLCLSMDILAEALMLFPSDILFVWHAPQFQPDVFAVVKGAGWTPFVSIVWNKNVANFAALGATYKAKYEMAIGCKKDRIPFYGPNNEVTVWDIDRASVNEWHPTQKPVALFERLINNHTRPGEICAEPFAGGGSQFIAAELTGRKCYGMELEPKYCDVILSRYEQATGKTAELIEHGTT